MATTLVLMALNILLLALNLYSLVADHNLWMIPVIALNVACINLNIKSMRIHHNKIPTLKAYKQDLEEYVNNPNRSNN